MRRLGQSGVAVLALVGCSAVGLALGGCSSDSDSGIGSASASGVGYSDVVQVTGTSASPPDSALEASDPRVSGKYTNSPECELIPDGGRTIGYCPVTSTMTNDGGSWEGGCTGTTTWSVTEPEHMHDFDCTMVGSGGYLGLRFRYNIRGGDGPWEMTGQIESFPASP